MEFSAAIPILRIFSVEKAKEFYLDFLGFTLDWEHRFSEDLPLYAQVSRSGLTLHLSEHHGDSTPGSAVFIPMGDIDALHQELSAKQYRYARPGVETVDWGKELNITDPFGNRLRFCQQISNS
ncbi:Bleomycin resistance protein [Serratia grimesii]|jgi:catechol 2,3-dioxygenase-like lactoylglutathione lyase family enzyme|uniref:Bleomycin resistance protein n=1 Tax=Serratia grimesii TaxID=82995 RepID=A0A7G2JSS1_9GAMM|nr:glyoxalase superfamily protein [Serratia grimesii]CAI0854882.1 Phleomycin resistance protein [Serratia grimesii]CAI0918069.1 Phleomycin resistance protein [Serratia grimesii]CAI1624844.1 Phleomycin resistance protein [Serratia grimesii]CAI2410748.1 Phleomycin resistance protein [Serratia grimesii]CAI2789097.1 Phleomycin resistance protein [Serratia grimesii]